MARVLLALGQKMPAVEVMQQAQYRLQELRERSGNIQPIIALAVDYGVRFWLAQGDFFTAEHWLDEMDVSIQDEIKSEKLASYLLLARLYLAQNRLGETEGLLERIDTMKDAAMAVRPVIECHILQAMLYQAQGEQQRALDLVSEALLLAEPEGFIRLFVDEGQPMVNLLQAAARQRINFFLQNIPIWVMTCIPFIPML